ncbi:ABC transporter ATP-binding protein [Leptospira sp. 'Mane']|uniref:ABC transporter ATP-binding protein n=1 Tax=Leptospira sp. 'Mane' TaxID=3387407 RepID=UPI00398B29C0
MQAIRLFKQFPGKMAVADLNFTLVPGRLTALLGPNGAGKTTTMRLLSGFLDPTTGEVRMEGVNLSASRKSLLQKIGYLPENGPSYKDLTVMEFLHFLARIRGFGAAKSAKVIYSVVEELILGDVRNSIIGNLSKGYRQRVALAGVLLGDPDYLILDEPSYGLDPKQMTQIRRLILSLSKHKTVLISTHSLEEVEEICDHVIILANGKIVADSSVQTLRKKDKLYIEVKAEYSEISSLFQKFGFMSLTSIETPKDGFGKYELSLGEKNPEEVFQILANANLSVREMRRSEDSLKTIFDSITSGQT